MGAEGEAGGRVCGDARGQWGSVAREVVPSINVIEPVGVPLPGATAATWAVKVKVWPKTPGFADETEGLFVW